MTTATKKNLYCTRHGRVEAELVRGEHRYADVVLTNAVAFVCPQCGTALAFPSASTGRVAQAIRAKRPPVRRDFRVPVEIEDEALAVHAALGTLGAGEDFTLPLHLGIQVAGRESKPRERWKVHDGQPCAVRARPLLTADTQDHLEGLASAWGAGSVSDVVRWLIVAAADAVRAGLQSAAREPAMVMALPTRSVQVATGHQETTTGAFISVAATSARYHEPLVA